MFHKVRIDQALFTTAILNLAIKDQLWASLQDCGPHTGQREKNGLAQPCTSPHRLALLINSLLNDQGTETHDGDASFHQVFAERSQRGICVISQWETPYKSNPA